MQSPGEQERDSWNRKVEPKSWYASLRNIGYGYGPHLQKLSAIEAASGSNAAKATVTVHETSYGSSSYAAHPVVIDNFLQLATIAASRGLAHRLKLMVPVAIEHLSVTASSQGEGSSFTLSAHVDRTKNGYEGEITGINTAGARVQLIGCSLVPMAFGQNQSPLELEQLRWHPLLPSGSVAELISISKKQKDQTILMEELALLCILESARVAKSQRVRTYHMKKYSNWLQTQALCLRDHGSILVPEAQDWASKSLPALRAIKAKRAARAKEKLEPWQHDLILRVSENTVPLLSGNKGAIQLLYDDDGLKQFYRGTHSLFDCTQFLSQFGHATPGLKVLEIGSGTGGFTSHVLKALEGSSKRPLYSKYAFTDISSGFFPTAQQHLSGNAGIEYSVLDISQDPMTQGFFEAEYDLVVHCTPSLSETLRNVYNLLKPDGKILMVELCPATRFLNYIMVGGWESTINVSMSRMSLLSDGIESSSLLGSLEQTLLSTIKNNRFMLVLSSHRPKNSHRDILEALGTFGENVELGMEASGIIRRVGSRSSLKVGQRVLVMAPNGLFATRVVVPSQDCVAIPENLSLEQAASFSCIYGTALLALLYQSNMSKGKSILIHSACGGIGLAAIAISRMKDAKIYATVGNDAKAKYLNERFGIPFERIFSSHDQSFYTGLMRATDGKGVDIVLNSLAGELFHASWECVAKYGKMIEIGKRDIMGDGSLRLGPFLHNRSFTCVNAGEVMIDQPEMYRRVIEDGLRYIEQGLLEPIKPIRVFPAKEVEQAFRHMQSGQHIGKVLLQMPEKTEELPHKPYGDFLEFSAEACYLIIGGLGGIGRVVSRWMVDRGARELVFLSRSSPSTHSQLVSEFEAQGCRVVIVQGTVAKGGDIQKALHHCEKPVRGVFQMAMVLKERPVLQMSWNEWRDALEPKVTGTWNLHLALRNAKLDFFVLFSSIAGIVGQPGLANYAAANTYLDAFVQYRHSLGLPAAVIDIGVVAGGDHVVERLSGGSLVKTTYRGYRTVHENDVLKAVELAVAQQSPATDKDRLQNRSQIILGLSPSADGEPVPDNRPIYRDSRMKLLLPIDSGSRGSHEESSQIQALLGRISQDSELLSSQEVFDVVRDEISRQLAPLTNLCVEEIGYQQPFTQLGIDSLVVTELRIWLRQTFHIETSVPEIMGAGHIDGLTDLTLRCLAKS
ncbi:hypothetical protein BBP40_011947 [Aspergillus hancockii]|nr:hypothetical protein BBP40_011947 [Aspergillus hancockii]